MFNLISKILAEDEIQEPVFSIGMDATGPMTAGPAALQTPQFALDFARGQQALVHRGGAGKKPAAAMIITNVNSLKYSYLDFHAFLCSGQSRWEAGVRAGHSHAEGKPLSL